MFEPIQNHDTRRKHVLYVEDLPANVLLMRAMFSRRPGYRLQIATDGASGLEAAHVRQPDLLLIDINLPDCLGSELLQQLRSIPGCARTPAIAVTADHSFDVQGTSFAEVWHKPLSLQDTLDRLDHWLFALPHQGQAADQARPAAATAFGPR